MKKRLDILSKYSFERRSYVFGEAMTHAFNSTLQSRAKPDEVVSSQNADTDRLASKAHMQPKHVLHFPSDDTFFFKLAMEINTFNIRAGGKILLRLTGQHTFTR